ncbi:MAG: TonB-dependent receptor domain-containing protein, partial [Rhodothermales bacterium]
MRTLFTKLLFLVLLGLVPGLALAQTGTLSGTITDSESGEPLPGANVFIEELSAGAAADIDGNYSISDISVGTYTVRVSFVGFKSNTQAYTVSAGSNTLNVALAPDYTGLEEVVITGIASSTSKARAEVAVSRVDATKLQEQNSYQDLSQLMSGKVAGVNVQPASGNVAGGIRFVMRSSTGLNGSGQPVIYVDGVRIDNAQISGPGQGVGGQGISMLANLNPEDIESVDILKGPAGAALYGTSGSNGVVLITTKRGKLAGGGIAPFNVTYKGTLGANSQFEEYDRDNASLPDLANDFFRDGTISQHSISVSGGSDVVRYFTSYDKRFEEGHINNNEQDRQSFRANFEAFPVQNVTVRANAAYTLNEIARPQNDNNIFGYLGNSLLANSPFVFTDSLSIENLKADSRISRFLASAEVEYQPITNLRLRASVGFDGTDTRSDRSFPANLRYSGRTNGERNIFNRRNEQYTYDFNARYSYDITSSLNATTIVGSQAFNRINNSSNITKQNFSTELITNVGAGADFIAADEGFLHSREAGIYGQQEFAYQNRIFVTLGVRRDFASTVGEGAPAIWYPKASLALRLDQIVNLPSAINFLKLRAAYGETGQLPSLLDKAFLRWEAEPSGYGAGAVLNFIGNTEIEPERIKEIEVGLEAELFDNVGLDLTYYRQDAKNSIIDFENVPSTGQTASNVPFNVGDAKGWGIEASLSAAPIRTRNFGVDFNIIWNFQDNEVEDLGGAQPNFSGFDTQVIKEGLPRDAFFTWSSKASFNDDGSYAGAVLVQTADEDGDGTPDRDFFG